VWCSSLLERGRALREVRRFESLNSSRASSTSDSDGTRQPISPATPIASRLVANSVNPAAAPSRATTRSAHASSRCSQVAVTVIEQLAAALDAAHEIEILDLNTAAAHRSNEIMYCLFTVGTR
jgi:hypothetical protein